MTDTVEQAEVDSSNVIKVNPQNLACFPNDNSKHIDFVITYKYDTDREQKESHKTKEAIRDGFVDLVKKENIDVYTIRHVDGDDCTVVHLLSCSMDRLLNEAEKTKLEMRLSNVESLLNKFISIGIRFALKI
jgi:hypothetical protein